MLRRQRCAKVPPPRNLERSACYRPDSPWLDVGPPNYLGPFPGIVDNEPAELGRRGSKRLDARIGEPRFERRIGEGNIYLRVKDCDELQWRTRGGADAIPPGRLVAWHKVAYGRNIRQQGRSCGSGYAEWPQLAGPDLTDR